ncbi:MAG TPA: TetR-like C-terminal domain-containing protein [Candidatus Solibacter sp.]|nr:TetR-like C-terminal domain-containing protein [Candidatus Solibacter sp.]
MRMLEPTELADTGAFLGDLKEMVRPVADERGTVSQSLVTQIIAEAQYDSVLASEIYSKVIAPYRRLQQPVFERAAARRDIPKSLDTNMLLDALYGAYFHRVLFHHGEVDAAFFDALVELLVYGAAPRTKGAKPRTKAKRKPASARR